MIFGNKIGGNSVGNKTFVIDINGDEVWGVMVDDPNIPEPTACCEDVMIGQVFVGPDGLQEGKNDSPCCRVTDGVHEIGSGVEVLLRISKCEQWDFNTLHGVIVQKSTPHKVEKLIMNSIVYDSEGNEISRVTKDSSTCSIRFNIKNETTEPQLLYFFICKEERHEV